MTDNDYYRQSLREKGETKRAECQHSRIKIMRDKATEHNTYTCDECGELAEVDMHVVRKFGGRGLMTFFTRIFGPEPEERMHY